MTLTLELSPELEARLKTNAAVRGKDVTDYVVMLVENDTPIDLTEFEDTADFQASVAGIREGLADLDAGRSISLEEMAALLEGRAEARRRRRVTAASEGAA
jgi:predicted transcriptional regulator